MTSHIPKEDQMGAVVCSISMSLGDEPPGHPVFVLTHHAREPLAKQGGTTFNFVTDGIEAALEQARTRRVRLLDRLDPPRRIEVEKSRVIDSPAVTHLSYRVVSRSRGPPRWRPQ
jgi:hypothetical protein